MELSSNSKEMKTEVETFVIEETASLIYDNEKLDKWNDLVKDLNLKGQTKIIATEKSPIPFMFIKTGMLKVFETLCPKKVDVTDYDITPIPLEILDLVALSVRESYFTKIQIWHDDKDPDPLCIGIFGKFIIHQKGTHTQIGKDEFKTKKEAEAFLLDNNIVGDVYDYSWGGSKHYLLGKWADVKHSFEELREMATKRFVAEQSNYHRKQIIDAQRNLDDLEVRAFELFN